MQLAHPSAQGLNLAQGAQRVSRGKWVLDWLLCDIWISLDVLLCTASILSLCAISIDRYLAITQPLNYSRKIRSKRLAMFMILAVWMVAAAITCPPILGWYDKDRHINSTSCTYNQNVGYVVFSAMGSFFIPLIVMLYVYARISCVIAHRHSQLTALDSISQKEEPLLQHVKKKLVVLMFGSWVSPPQLRGNLV
uniref:G-protein coupled receptors family 1 profile domain-containing protein n=1 Tax=Timema monikensis TaxID=170555 RepID=A0A7R9EEZ7_9NEOP|nr:unnamed protein product [Timema monikensis]